MLFACMPVTLIMIIYSAQIFVRIINSFVVHMHPFISCLIDGFQLTVCCYMLFSSIAKFCMLQEYSDVSSVTAYHASPISLLTPASFLTFQILQRLDTIGCSGPEPSGSLHSRQAMHGHLLCFRSIYDPTGPSEGTCNTCQWNVTSVDCNDMPNHFRPARCVKLQAPPTAQQMDKMGLECQMLTLLSTWLLDLSDVELPHWPMQHTASRTGALTGAVSPSSSPNVLCQYMCLMCAMKQMHAHTCIHANHAI